MFFIIAAVLVCTFGCTVGDTGTSKEVGDAIEVDETIALAARKPGRTGSCGNGKCGRKESCESCPVDCGQCTQSCGDGTCDADEDCTSCSADCGECEPACGDDTCDATEDCSSCAADCGSCGPVCDNGTCEAGEDCSSCAADCGDCGTCGDQTCGATEDCTSCEADCGPCDSAVCGDATCQADAGEMCTTCSDCDTADAVCGNGHCQAGETSASCYGDCGPEQWDAGWLRWEDDVVTLINRERAAGTNCPSSSQDKVGPLVMNQALRAAAQLHSWDMSFSGYFSHTSCNGRSPWQRAADQGTSASGETIGGSFSSPQAIVDGWMNSQGHCEILMSGRTEVGVGYASARSGRWTALFR